MPQVIYIQSNGDRCEIDVPNGTSLMLAATAHGIEGIVGECGGAMSCATCHIFVDPAFVDLLPPIDETENQMLAYTAAARTDTSRLSCQVVMTQALDGITVHIADPQL